MALEVQGGEEKGQAKATMDGKNYGGHERERHTTRAGKQDRAAWRRLVKHTDPRWRGIRHGRRSRKRCRTDRPSEMDNLQTNVIGNGSVVYHYCAGNLETIAKT